jgi:MYXO-CTERM domain-containing protein
MLASADELAAIGLAAQPVLDSVPRAPAAAHPGGHTASAIMLNEIASLFVSDRSSGASADSAAPVVFWVFGSGLLGAAFVARRRKPARSKS